MKKKPWKNLLRGNITPTLVLGWLGILVLIAVGAAVMWLQFF